MFTKKSTESLNRPAEALSVKLLAKNERVYFRAPITSIFPAENIFEQHTHTVVRQEKRQEIHTKKAREKLREAEEI